MSDFDIFCRNATDRQLANIINKEHANGHYTDRDAAEREARSRGWDEARIRDARIGG
jgi:hypothetical protein